MNKNPKVKLDLKFRLVKKIFEGGKSTQSLKQEDSNEYEKLSNFIKLNEEILNKKRLRNEINLEDSSISEKDKFKSNTNDFFNQTATFKNSYSSINSSRIIMDNSNKNDGTSIITENRQASEISDITVVKVNPCKISEDNSLIKSIPIVVAKKESNNNVFSMINNDKNDSSFLGNLDDYKSSSDVSDTTYKNNIDFDYNDKKDYTSSEKDEEIKINDPEYEDSVTKPITDDSLNHLMRKDTSNKVKIENLKKDNNSQSLNETYKIFENSDVKDKTLFPKVIKIGFKHVIDSIKKQKQERKLKIDSNSNSIKKEIILQGDFSSSVISCNDLLFSVILYFSVSCSIIYIINFVASKGDISEAFSELIISKEIQDLIERNLENKGYDSDYYISETQIHQYCTEDLKYSNQVYEQCIIPLVKSNLLTNPKIQTSYSISSNDLPTIVRWNLKYV